MSEGNKLAVRTVPEQNLQGHKNPIDSNQLQRLLNLTPSVIYATDLLDNNACTFVSENIMELMGYETGEMLQDPGFWYSHIHPDDAQRVVDDCDSAIRHGGGCLEYRFEHHNGTYKWIEDRFRVLHDDLGRPKEVVGHWSDISARKEIELALVDSHAVVERHSHEIEILAEMNDHLHVCESIDETRGILGHFLKELFPKDAGAIFIFNQSRSMLELIAEWGKLDGVVDVFSQGDCWVLRQGKPHLVVGNTHPLTCSHTKTSGNELTLCVPMIAQSDVMGLLMLSAGSTTRTAIKNGSNMMETMQALAVNASKQLALSLMNLRLRDSLKIQTLKDPLTQLYNRRFMTEFLDKEIIKSKRSGSTLGVFMIDVDHFKQFNDLNGHDAGDAVLRELGEYMKKTVRASDVACRYGGEEFSMLLPDSTRESLNERAEELRNGVKSLRIMHHKEQLGTISISIGVAMCPDHGDSYEALLATADKALYKAKKQGRDRVVFADIETVTI